MKKKIKKILYIGMEAGACPECNKNRSEPSKSNGSLVIHKLPTGLPFPKGELQVYTAFIPEYSGRTFFLHKLKPWKPEKISEILSEVELHFLNEVGEGELVLGRELKGLNVPVELLAVRLYQNRPFPKICISLPNSERLDWEENEAVLEQAITLLEPYLSGLQQVILAGKPSQLSEALEEYLFLEYGMLMVTASKPPKDVLWLDLREQEVIEKDISRAFWNNTHIYASETLKFLDTTAKNGYNTEVN